MQRRARQPPPTSRAQARKHPSATVYLLALVLADVMIATTSICTSCGATTCFSQCALPRDLQRKFVTLGLPSPPFYPIVPTWSAKNRPPVLATDAEEAVF